MYVHGRNDMSSEVWNNLTVTTGDEIVRGSSTTVTRRQTYLTGGEVDPR